MLRDAIRRTRVYQPLHFVFHLLFDPRFRRDQWFRLRQPQRLYQVSSVTFEDRYPLEFRFVRDWLGDSSERSLLSFGCSTGEEVFSLRRYFPSAAIKGIDINPDNIAICKRRLSGMGAPALAAKTGFAAASGTDVEPAGHYDAIFCMAVLRHGALTKESVQRCDPVLRFADFEVAVNDFARCLKPGGLLVIQHSNFRFGDTDTATGFEPVLRLGDAVVPGTPIFDRNNGRVPDTGYGDVVFRKR